MRKLSNYQIILALALLFAFALAANSQSRANRLFRPCPATTTAATVEISRAGAISLIPCTGQLVTVSGLFAGLTTQGSVVFVGSSGLTQDNAGFFYDDATNQLRLTASAATQTPLAITGAAAQTGNLQEWRNSSATVLASISKDGSFVNGNDSSGTSWSRIFPLAGNSGFEWSNRTQDASPFFHTTPASGESMRQSSDKQITWASGVVGIAGQDTGVARFAAGVLRVSNGSTSIRGLIGGGAAVVSAAALPIPTGRVFHVTGNTNITSITSTNFAAGVCITMIFDGTPTVTDNNGTLDLAGNLVATANDTISLCYDGTNWYETGRSVN